MRHFLLGLLLCLVPVAAWAQQSSTGAGVAEGIPCNKTAVYDTNTNGATQLVAPASNVRGVAEQIYICGYTIWSGGTVNVSLEYGTKVSTDCDTGAHAITPAFRFTIGLGITDDSPVFRGLMVPFTAANTPQQLCILTSAGTAVQAIVYYAQF